MDARSALIDDDVVLRPARERDVARMASIEAACFSDPWPASAFDSLLESHTTRVTVATIDDVAVGYSVVFQVADESELANVAVDASARRRGVARTLVGALLDRATREGVLSMFLEVRESNAAARALYAAFGFTGMTRRRGYYRHPDEDALVLVWRAPLPTGSDIGAR